jgi:predicted amidohydrolase
MKIGLMQFHAVLGQPDTNIRRMLEFIKLASKQECKLVVFPEVVDTGYEMQTIRKFASSWNSSNHLSILQESASKNAIYVVAGLTERVGTDVYNAAAVINPNGEIIGHYRKMHLFSAEPTHEELFLKPGCEIAMFNINKLKCGVIICSDLQFPELARLYAINDVHLLLVLSAWCREDIYHWKILLAARAIENQIFVGGVNRVGKDNSVTFCGLSQILNPLGELLASASEEEEELVCADIAMDQIDANRSIFSKLQGRRPELYKGLWKENGTVTS